MFNMIIDITTVKIKWLLRHRNKATTATLRIEFIWICRQTSMIVKELAQTKNKIIKIVERDLIRTQFKVKSSCLLCNPTLVKFIDLFISLLCQLLIFQIRNQRTIISRVSLPAPKIKQSSRLDKTIKLSMDLPKWRRGQDHWTWFPLSFTHKTPIN